MPKPPPQLDMFSGRPPTAADARQLAFPREPIPAPPDPQLDLLTARSTRLAPVAALLADAQWDAAANACAELADEVALTAELRLVASSTPDDSMLQRPWPKSPSSIAWACERGRCVELARRYSASGSPYESAYCWLVAGREPEARRELGRALETDERVGALTTFALLDRRAGNLAGAREHLRIASWLEPRAVAWPGARDDELEAACEQLADLVPEGAIEWLPVVGFALNLWPLGKCEALDATTPPAKFHAAIVRSRVATARGRADAAARREMKALAPALFERLMADEKL